MKRKLESELMSIAHRILKLKGKEDVNKLYAEVSELYEKLSVLKFAQENFEDKIRLDRRISSPYTFDKSEGEKSRRITDISSSIQSCFTGSYFQKC